jgi:hypothetical protein
MNYLTQYYKNLAQSLQEQVDYLESMVESNLKEKAERAQRRRDSKKHKNKPHAGDGGRRREMDRRFSDVSAADSRRMHAGDDDDEDINESATSISSQEDDGFGTDELPTSPLEPEDFSDFVRKHGAPPTPENWSDKMTPELRKKGENWAGALRAARERHAEWQRKIKEKNRVAKDEEGNPAELPSFKKNP